MGTRSSGEPDSNGGYCYCSKLSDEEAGMPTDVSDFLGRDGR